MHTEKSTERLKSTLSDVEKLFDPAITEQQFRDLSESISKTLQEKLEIKRELLKFFESGKYSLEASKILSELDKQKLYVLVGSVDRAPHSKNKNKENEITEVRDGKNIN